MTSGAKTRFPRLCIRPIAGEAVAVLDIRVLKTQAVHKLIRPFQLIPRIPPVLPLQFLVPTPRLLHLFRGPSQVPVRVILVRPTGVAVRAAPGGSVIPLLQLVQRIVLVGPRASEFGSQFFRDFCHSTDFLSYG